MTSVLARDELHASALIAGMVEECLRGERDREAEAIGIAVLWGLDVDPVRERFALARLAGAEAKREAEVKAAEATAPIHDGTKESPSVSEPNKGAPRIERRWPPPVKKISPNAQPQTDTDKGATEKTDAGEVAKALASPKSEPTVQPETKPQSESFLVPAQPKRIPLGFQHSKSPAGIPASLENAITAINGLNLDCRYDVFHDRIIVKGHESNVSGDVLENLENVTLKLRQTVLERFYFDPGAQFTFDALKLRCLDHVFDPVRDYLDSLKWDGRPRLDEWLLRYCRAEDTELNRAIGRKMLLAGVRRVRTPGCKFDYIVALEGAQGVGKSTLLKTLAGEDNFSDNEIIGLDKREQQEAIQGVWIYEIAELDGLHKSDVTKVKLFASKTVDSARPAYARSRVDRPRRGIFVATTNEDTYLRDTTGNRRFWPVTVGKIDLSAVARDRDQIWAEAAFVEAQGEPLVIPEALWPDAAAQQQARMELDPWEDVLAKKLAQLQEKQAKLDGSFMPAADSLGNSEWRVSTDYLLTTVLGLSKERQTNNHTKRLASIMRALDWTRPETPIRVGKSVCRGFTQGTTT